MCLNTVVLFLLGLFFLRFRSIRRLVLTPHGRHDKTEGEEGTKETFHGVGNY
jgi:hypothetical protein